MPSTALLDDLSAVSEDVVLVLDDDHVIRARDVQDEVASLLGNRRPPQLRIVASRRVQIAAFDLSIALPDVLTARPSVVVVVRSRRDHAASGW